MTDEQMWAEQNHQLSEIDDQLQNLLSKLNGHVKGCSLENTNHYEFTLRIILNMDSSYGGTYLPISGKDMRYYVPKINSTLKIDFIKEITYIEKPSPEHYTSKYLGETINWNLGYDSNIFLIKIKTNGNS